MLDIEKLEKEFIFLRNILNEIGGHLIKSELIEAAFKIGCIHNVCNTHAIGVGNLIHPKIMPEQAAQEMPQDAPAL